MRSFKLHCCEFPCVQVDWFRSPEPVASVSVHMAWPVKIINPIVQHVWPRDHILIHDYNCLATLSSTEPQND